LKKLAGGDYRAYREDVTIHDDGTVVKEFSVYTKACGYVKSASWQEAIDNLRDELKENGVL
jgi:CRISPR/Cas system-associated protein endoribonuclease Cas2